MGSKVLDTWCVRGGLILAFRVMHKQAEPRMRQYVSLRLDLKPDMNTEG